MTTKPFTSRVAPGAVSVEGRLIEYALRRPSCGCAIVQIVDLFPCGDERAMLPIPLNYDAATMSDEQLRELVEAAIYRAAATFVLGKDPEEIVVPEQIGSWPRGMTEGEIAAYNRAIAEAAAPEPVTKIVALEERRRLRAAR